MQDWPKHLHENEEGKSWKQHNHNRKDVLWLLFHANHNYSIELDSKHCQHPHSSQYSFGQVCVPFVELRYAFENTALARD
jgi:hypothetical protein